MNTTTIKSISARQIFDSRGKPTIEVDLATSNGMNFRAAVPSGASTGIHEACELRDGDKTKYLGAGVSKAISNVNNIIGPALVESGLFITQQQKIDTFMCELDGTPNKSLLGANAILGVSLAVTRAAAAELNMPLYRYIARLAGNERTISLPVPSFNVINGGSHAGNKLAVQEFMILPTGASSFSEAMQIGTEIYHNLKSLIKKTYGQDAINVGDEGGFAPNLSNVYECLDLLMAAIKVSSYEGRVKIALDCAASEFYLSEGSSRGKYDLDFKETSAQTAPHRILSGDELVSFYLDLKSKYPIVSIEDPFDQDDFASWTSLTAKAAGVQIVGDDLTVTNPKRIQMAANQKACDCLLLKVNQIGTITESIEAANLARSFGWGVMVSHRSGETEDTFIADLVVGLGVGQIKCGAPCRSERLAKMNQLLRIEEELGQDSVYSVPPAFLSI